MACHKGGVGNPKLFLHGVLTTPHPLKFITLTCPAQKSHGNCETGDLAVYEIFWDIVHTNRQASITLYRISLRLIFASNNLKKTLKPSKTALQHDSNPLVLVIYKLNFSHAIH